MNGRRIFRRYFFHDLPNERGEKGNKKPTADFSLNFKSEPLVFPIFTG